MAAEQRSTSFPVDCVMVKVNKRSLCTVGLVERERERPGHSVLQVPFNSAVQTSVHDAREGEGERQREGRPHNETTMFNN